MKKTSTTEFKTGVRTFSSVRLKPYVEAALEKGDSYNSLYAAMIRVPGGKGITGSRLKSILDGKSGESITSPSAFALCSVLRVTWEEISEPMDQP